MKGTGNQQDYGMRIYDPRVGRFLSVDPLTKEYPELTPYQFASNRPIDGTDLDGLEYNNASTYVHKTVPQLRPVNASVFAPPSEPTILKFNPYRNVGEIGPRSDVNARIEGSRLQYNQQIANNIIGGIGGSLGYLVDGDRGSFIGAAADGLATPFMSLPGRSSVFPSKMNMSGQFISEARPPQTNTGFQYSNGGNSVGASIEGGGRAFYNNISSSGGEKFFRSMNSSAASSFLRSGKMPAGTETFVSPTSSFAGKFDGVLFEINLRPGTVNALEKIGVRNDAAGHPFSALPLVQKGWMRSNAFFKAEGGQINIGLGTGDALKTFNSNIQNYRVIDRWRPN